MTQRAALAVALVAALVAAALLVPRSCREEDAGDALPVDASAPSPSAPASAPPPPPLDIPTFVVEPASSELELTGAAGAAPYRARFTRFSGRFRLNGVDVEGSAFELRAEAASIESDSEPLARSLASADFLEADRHPEITFVSRRIRRSAEGYEVTGNLTLHGVLAPVTFVATVTSEDSVMRLAGSLPLDRKDFGIAVATAPDDPLRDEAALELDLVLRRTAR